jgi:hypothetical protein
MSLHPRRHHRESFTNAADFSMLTGQYHPRAAAGLQAVLQPSRDAGGEAFRP